MSVEMVSGIQGIKEAHIQVDVQTGCCTGLHYMRAG